MVARGEGRLEGLARGKERLEWERGEEREGRSEGVAR